MANYERRVYEPSDEIRVFDGSEEDDEDIEGSRLPLLIVLALLVLAMFAGVVWLAYTQGVARGRSEAPLLAAPAGPERVAPSQQAGSNVPYQGFKIYEQPAPDDESGDNQNPSAKPQARSASTPAFAAKPPAAKAPASASKAAPAMAAKPKPSTAQAGKETSSKAASLAALIEKAEGQSAAPKAQAASKAGAHAESPPPANGAPRQLGAAAHLASASPEPATGPLNPAVMAGQNGAGEMLQIGAYKSHEEADQAWQAYKAKHRGLVSGYSPDIKQVDLGDKGLWYRLRIGGLADRQAALDLCERLKADGGACFLAR